MKALAYAVLFVSCACQASGGCVADLAKAGVEAARHGTLTALNAAQSATIESTQNIAQDLGASNEFTHDAVEVCRAGVDGAFLCCCIAANRIYEFTNDRLVRSRVAVARCTHAACTAIDGVLGDDTAAAAVARQVMEAAGLTIFNGLELAEAGHETVMVVGVRGLDLAREGARLTLKGVDVAADVGFVAGLVGLTVVDFASNFGFWAGRRLVNTVADAHVNLIDTVDNALAAGRPQRLEGGHAHEE